MKMLESISNHMYRTAASTARWNERVISVMQEKWRISPLHIFTPNHNKYPECGHGELKGEAGNQLQLQPGSNAAGKLEEFLLKPHLLSCSRTLSLSTRPQLHRNYRNFDIEIVTQVPDHNSRSQTQPEQFVPKDTAFSYCMGNAHKVIIYVLPFW